MAKSDRQHDRLRKLARSLPAGRVVPASELLGARRAGDAETTGPRDGRGAPSPRSLSEACGGAPITVETPAGEAACWLVRRTLDEVEAELGPVASEYSAVLRGARQRLGDDAALEASRGLCRAADGRPEDLLFAAGAVSADAEEVLFLLGTMTYRDGRLVLAQCLAREPSEEAALLGAFAERYAAAGVLATYPGRGVGWRGLRKRCEAHGIELPRRRRPPHLDLRREARRAWRGDVPDFHLETLERCVCRRRRAEPMPPRQEGRAYARFLSTGDARPLTRALHHNALDLAAMAQVLVALLTGCGPVME